MAKKGRPFTYQRAEERPVTISLRLARDLYDRLERYAQRHRHSVSELVRDGIEMRLAVQADPRWQTAQAQGSYYDNTVLQELATPAHLLDDRIPFDDEHLPMSAPATPVVADMSHNNNTVIQEAGSPHRGRKLRIRHWRRTRPSKAHQCPPMTPASTTLASCARAAMSITAPGNRCGATTWLATVPRVMWRTRGLGVRPNARP